jgi:thiamine-monophosphate kinase
MNTSEADLIRRLRASAAALRPDRGIALGIGDDAALFVPRRGYEMILTCDWFLEGTHFLGDKHPADAVGWKCLARAVSDVAAMGGEPRFFLLSLALLETHTGRWLDAFLTGLRRAARKFRCPLAGGDTTRRRSISINVTVAGEVRRGWAVLRSGARPGDILYVSGRLGEAEWGLRELRGKSRTDKNAAARKKHLYPEPRLALGHWLSVSQMAAAMMDLSDGLSTDLPRLCAASGVGSRIEAAKIPAVAVGSRHRVESVDPSDLALDLALDGGDDYELLFAVRPDKARRMPRVFQGIPLTSIGQITRERSLTLVRRDGGEEPLRARGWDPFRK